MFVVATNYAGVYLYPYGYFNVAVHPYQQEAYHDLSAHLTNEHLNESESNVVQIPTQQFDFFPPLLQQIRTIITEVMRGLQKLEPNAFICEKQRTLAIFGFDFMVDDERRVWLLEANHGPCFPATENHPLQGKLYDDFWRAFIASFVRPITERQLIDEIQYRLFTPLFLWDDTA